MAVKVHCSICDKFIKDVSNYDFQKLTGDEVCEKCGKKVKGMYGKLDSMISDIQNDITDRKKRITVLTNAFFDSIKRIDDELKSFHTTRKAELDSRMRDILK